MKKLFLLVIVGFISSCSLFDSKLIIGGEEALTKDVRLYPSAQNKPSQNPFLQVAWSHLPEGNAWTVITQEAIETYGQSLMSIVPDDIEDFCPRYLDLTRGQKGDFWVHLISKLAYYESDYNTDEMYTENFPDRNGIPVISRGLLQLSKESANGYGCHINNPLELNIPQINLACAVRIMNHWVPRDGIIVKKIGQNWRGVARYWSPFRNNKKRQEIKLYTSSLRMCH